jgi:hypothetical protein
MLNQRYVVAMILPSQVIDGHVRLLQEKKSYSATIPRADLGST